MIVDQATVAVHKGKSGLQTLLLSEAGGLTQFGAYRDSLPPGATSTRRHWHDSEDEFLYVLEGVATVVDNDGPQDLTAGDAACWRHGEPNGHHIRNLTDAPLHYLIVGSRVARDICHYPDDGQRQVHSDTHWQMVDADGIVLRGGPLPDELLSLPPRWGKAFDGVAMPKVIRKGSVPGVDGCGYPEIFDTLGPYTAWPLSDAGGLTQFGAFTETLMPGSQSSQRHWHEAEDEFLYVLEGEVTVIEEDGGHLLSPGQVACWPKGVPNAHCLRNLSSRPVLYLIAGARLADDRCHYPDIDLLYTRHNGVRTMSHKDGAPYPGWPRGVPK